MKFSRNLFCCLLFHLRLNNFTNSQLPCHFLIITVWYKIAQRFRKTFTQCRYFPTWISLQVAYQTQQPWGLSGSWFSVVLQGERSVRTIVWRVIGRVGALLVLAIDCSKRSRDGHAGLPEGTDWRQLPLKEHATLSDIDFTCNL